MGIVAQDGKESKGTSDNRSRQIADIEAALAAIAEPGQVVELRALKCGRLGTVSGYFDDMHLLAVEAARLDNSTPAPSGVYITLNRLPNALLARAANRARSVGKDDPTTADKDITRRLEFPIDADPVRLAGISSTDAEHEAALQRVARISAWLRTLDWPEPMANDSSNGGHLLYRIDLPNDTESADLLKRCLEALAAMFDDEAVKVDRSVFNAARIWKLYGTTSRKGDNTDDRPHRRSRLLSVPDRRQVVTVDQLRALAAMAPKPTEAPATHGKAPKQSKTVDFWKAETPEAVESWAAGHGLNLGERRTYDGGYKWSVDCLTSTDHKDAAALFLNADGFLNYNCFHNSCSGRKIGDVLRIHPAPAAITKYNRNGAGYKRGATIEEMDAEAYGREFGYGLECPEPPDEWPDAAELAEITAEELNRRSRLPMINVYQQLRTLRDAAMAAIVAANEDDPQHPLLLVHAGQLVRLKADEDDHTVVEIVNNGALLNILTDVADWVAVQDSEDEGARFLPMHPPANVVTALLNAGQWPELPSLEGVVYAPTFDRNGRLHTEPGYNPETRLYNAADVQLGDTAPTAENLQAALQLIDGDLFVDFPLVGDASLAHAYALLLLPFVRRMIDGPTPMHLGKAPAAGTGKSLLISVALCPGVGEFPEPITSPADPSEMDKTLTAKVIEAPPYLFIDNISGKLDSAALASALTQTKFNRRLLGTNTTVSGNVNWVWAGTANNPTISEELVRRSILISLDAGMERPDRRTKFKHPNIERWTKAHRAELVTAAVTIVRNWQENANSKRWNERAKGSFEEWVEIMGGILDAAGIPGFLANEDELREQAAPELANLREFVAVWAARHIQSPQTVGALMHIASTVELWTEDENGRRTVTKEGDDLLGAMLGTGNQKSRETKLGNLLNANKDRVFGGWRIVEAPRDPHTKSRNWQVIPVKTAEPRGTSRNLAEEILAQGSAHYPTLENAGFCEEPRNLAEPFSESNAWEQKSILIAQECGV